MEQSVTKKEDRITVFLRVADCDPDEVTQAVGLQPSLSWRVGDPVLSKSGQLMRYRVDHAWDFDSPLRRIGGGGGTMEEHLDSLLDSVMPHLEGFKRLPHDCLIKVYCGITAFAERPAIWFTKHQIECLSLLGAELDVDVYDYSRLGEGGA